MIPVLLMSLSLVGQVAGPRVDAAQFDRLVRGLHSDCQDVSFTYEGKCEYIGPDYEVKGDPRQFDVSYQGTYAYRSDGATLLDVFSRGTLGDRLLVRKTWAVLKDTMDLLERIPDLGKATASTQKRFHPIALYDTGSAERLLFLWHLRTLQDPAAYGYEFQGWEDVDGHRCMRVQMNMVPGAPGAKAGEVNKNVMYQRIWIDMDRGGHPLKYEIWVGPNLRSRADRIELEQVAAKDGKPTWIPVRGEYHAFAAGVRKYFKEPLFRETYAVVNGSVRVNQGLADRQFSVRSQEPLAGVPSGMRQLQQQTARLLPQRRTRVDPQGVKERLDRALAEADHQAARLEASSAARAVWGWTPILQIGLGTFGILLIGAAGVYKWRG